MPYDIAEIRRLVQERAETIQGAERTSGYVSCPATTGALVADLLDLDIREAGSPSMIEVLVPDFATVRDEVIAISAELPERVSSRINPAFSNCLDASRFEDSQIVRSAFASRMSQLITNHPYRPTSFDELGIMQLSELDQIAAMLQENPTVEVDEQRRSSNILNYRIGTSGYGARLNVRARIMLSDDAVPSVEVKIAEISTGNDALDMALNLLINMNGNYELILTQNLAGSPAAVNGVVARFADDLSNAVTAAISVKCEQFAAEGIDIRSADMLN